MSDEDELNFMIKRAEDSIKFHSSLPPRPIFRRPTHNTPKLPILKKPQYQILLFWKRHKTLLHHKPLVALQELLDKIKYTEQCVSF